MRGRHHHARILAAIEKRDPEAARAAMRDHLRQVREDSRKGHRREAISDSKKYRGPTDAGILAESERKTTIPNPS